MEYTINEKISVRPITEEDTDLIILWRNKPRIMNNFLVRTEVTRETHLNWLKTKVYTGNVRQFIIMEHTDDIIRPIGSVYIRDIDNEKLTAEYGIFIGEDDALGHGYGNQLVKWAVDYVRDMGMKTFTLRVLADNKPAIKSYEQAGFKQVDLVKNFIDGRDLVFMEIAFEDD
ncbi:MAG: GNAT family N-acetyltransferase [Lachnospiraceae bacterium]|nr:GNAT family N-acetyltransferase [Lachnospiraceae bacterium]